MNSNNTPFGLPQSVVDKITTVFRNDTLIRRVIIYGSRAIGNYRPGSDIDLCIDSDNMTLTQLFKIENQIDDLLLPWTVDLSLKNRIDNQNLLDHINHVGVIFYSKKIGAR